MGIGRDNRGNEIYTVEYQGDAALKAQIAAKADASAVPTPANSAPPAVADASATVASLLGLTILSVPSSPGVTWIHAVALEP